MKNRRSFRSSLAAVALGAVVLGGSFVAGAPAASASTPRKLPAQLQLQFQNLVVTKLDVYDMNNYGQPATIQLDRPSRPEDFNVPNPYQYLNPARIHAGDEIKVCATVMARFATVTTQTKIPVTGPDYKASVTVPWLVKGRSTTVCTPAYRLDFTRAAQVGLISTGPLGYFPGQQCTPIVLTATLGKSSAKSQGFLQDGLPMRCGYTA